MKIASWLSLVTLLVAGTAQAQSTSPPPAEASGGANAQGQGKPKESEEERDSAHFRFGLGLDGNYMLASGVQGAGVGLQLRLGAQINQWFATYYQGHAIVGGIVGGNTGGSVLGEGFNSLMAELTLPLLHIGAGPSIDFVGITGCSATGGCGSDSGAHFGLDGRVALVLGGHGPGRHGGFAINFNAHPTFVSGTTLTTLSLGLGGELY